MTIFASRNFISILLILTSHLGLASPTLSPEQAQELLKKSALCSEASCQEQLFSKKVSKLELHRTIDRLKIFKLDSKSQWKPCELKVKKISNSESCFIQQESENSYVRMFFIKESGQWKIQSVSLPLQD